jgi:hypothetical protein
MSALRRKREPSVASAIAAMAKAGLVPRLERRPDGSWVLTGLPPDKVVSVDHEAEDLGRKIDAMGGEDGDGV